MANEQKQCIMTLPLAERTIAVALKHVFDMIKKIDEEEAQETQKIHTSFVGKFKEIEQKTSAIIKGKPIPVEDLKGKEKYFQGDEVKQVDNLAKNNKPINDYWSVVMENFFRDDMTPQDKDIAKAVVDISTEITTEKIEVVFEIGNNPWVKAGTYQRRFLMQEGQATKVEGQKAIWLKERPDQGVMTLILDGGQSIDDLSTSFPVVGEMINDMVPYSLQFYLGVTDEAEGLDDLDEEQEEEIDDDEQDEGPSKKVKE